MYLLVKIPSFTLEYKRSTNWPSFTPKVSAEVKKYDIFCILVTIYHTIMRTSTSRKTKHSWKPTNTNGIQRTHKKVQIKKAGGCKMNHDKRKIQNRWHNPWALTSTMLGFIRNLHLKESWCNSSRRRSSKVKARLRWMEIVNSRWGDLQKNRQVLPVACFSFYDARDNRMWSLH